LLPVPLEAKSVAEFFRNTPGLSKANIGKYFGEKEDFNISALR
jgi:Sec7-like guanine-nucleotide exchange factor